MFVSLFLSALVASAVAQNGYTFPAGFNLGEVSISDRDSWCMAQRNTCPVICGGIASSNTCDPQSLSFSCVCSNGTSANVAPYQNTVPFFVCEANFGQCISGNAGDATAQEECKKQKKANCGTLNATEEAASSVSASSSSVAPARITTATAATTTAPAATTSAAMTSHEAVSTTAASKSTTTTTAANAAVQLVQDYSVGLLATTLFLVFRLAL